MVSSNKGRGIGTALPFGSASMASFSIENSVWSFVLIEQDILVPCRVWRSSKRRISKEFENFIRPEYGLLLFSLSFTMPLLNFSTLDYSARAVCTTYQYCFSHKLSLRAFIQVPIILILPTETKTEIIPDYSLFWKSAMMVQHRYQLCKAVCKDMITLSARQVIL